MKISKNNVSKFFKLIITLIMYVTYTEILKYLFLFTKVSAIGVHIISDLIFLIGIIFLYKNSLKDDYYKLKQCNKKRLIIEIIKYLLIILCMSVLVEAISAIFVHQSFSLRFSNTIGNKALFGFYSEHTLFKALIFVVIAEELIFHKALSEVINNKVLFVIISSLIYVAMNVMFGSPLNSLLWLDIILYSIFYFTLAIAYVKNDNNIFVPMIMKFIYNLCMVLLSIWLG